MEVIIGAVVALVILAGIHRAPQERNVLPMRTARWVKRNGLWRRARRADLRRTAVYWWFREPAKGAR